MDLKAYYESIRAQEATMPDAFPIVVSLATPDGGKAGIAAEVTRAAAAKSIVNGAARLATPEESLAFRAAIAAAKREADQRAAAARVEFSVLSTAELARLTGAAESKKDAA